MSVSAPMKPLHLASPVAAHRAAGRRHAHVADVLRRPSRRPGQVRTPDRRVAIATLRERYRPVPVLLRLAWVVVIGIGVVLLAAAFRQRDPFVAYAADPGGYDLALTLLRAECGGESCTVTLDLLTGDPPGPALADAMRGLGIQKAEHNPRVGESLFSPNMWEQTVRHRSVTPTAEQLHVRRNRARVWREDRIPGAGWADRGDGWFTRAPRR